MCGFEALVDDLTLDEQIGLMAGAGFWQTVPVPRLGIPAIKVSDGPNGARGSGSFTSGVPAAAFPVGISLASTWNLDLATRIGTALAQEAKSKCAQVLLAPTVNIHRQPLGGRNFESFSEDPLLAGRIGAAFVNALQAQGIAATVKHFAGNESEFERNSIDSQIDERTLRELYLRPFEIVVRESRPWVVMTAYNKLNGAFCSDNERLIEAILRDEWGFDGMTMSDWTGTRSTVAAANAGLDLEMPGPTVWRGAKLRDAVERGEVSRTAIRKSARRVLKLADRAGRDPSTDLTIEREDDRPEVRALIREAGAQGIVLLKNDTILPLDRQTVKSIAVIGPNAAFGQIMGGGSSQINAHYRVSPLAGIDVACGTSVDVMTAQGCTNYRLLPVLDNSVELTFFNSSDLTDDPVYATKSATTDQLWLGFIDPAVRFDDFSMRMTATFVPDRNAGYEIGVVATGPVRVLVDGTEVVDAWERWEPGGEYFGLASREYRGTFTGRQGQPLVVVAEHQVARERAHIGLKALRVGIGRGTQDDEIAEAVALARSSDVAIVCVGLSGEWDTEGMDRQDMKLPGRQNELVAEVAKANPRTVVVVQSGGPVELPWMGRVGALVQAWYPGQECGNAIADVLFGDVSPSGRLPQSWPARVEQNPAWTTYPGDHGVVRYGEGVFAGYRSYVSTGVQPLFPFGFGLGYTTYEYGEVTPSSATVAAGDQFSVSLDIRNSGERAGTEIVQVYVHDPVASINRPKRELRGFARVHLDPSASERVVIDLDMRSLAWFDAAGQRWIAEAGEFEIQVGASSEDIRSRCQITLADTWYESARDAWMSFHR